MCQYYEHSYTCKHTHWVLAKYCASGNLVQTACKRRTVWQKIRMGEDCEGCAMPFGRGNGVVEEGGQEVGKGKEGGNGTEQGKDEGKSKGVNVKRKTRKGGR